MEKKDGDLKDYRVKITEGNESRSIRVTEGEKIDIGFGVLRAEKRGIFYEDRGHVNPEVRTIDTMSLGAKSDVYSDGSDIRLDGECYELVLDDVRVELPDEPYPYP